jgi:pimeloyl-ACP methyl ester carboxylesterase
MEGEQSSDIIVRARILAKGYGRDCLSLPVMILPAALLAACTLDPLSSYDISSASVSHPQPSLERVEYRVESDQQALNRFSITHVASQQGATAGPVLLLSPFALPGSFYEISETGEYGKSAAGELARAGFDVWLVDQRRTGLAPGSCESGADCSAMAGWNFDAYSQDALFALSLLKSFNPEQKPVIGGFSAGSNAALATLNRAPDEFAGVFLYEGTFFTEDPAIRAHNDPLCTSLEAALAGGALFDPTPAVLGQVLMLAQADAASPSPFPFFPPGTSNRQAMLYVFGAPPPAGALAPTPTFVRNIVDFTTETFVYTDEQRLQLVGPLFDSYGSLAALRDLACGLAGRDDSHYWEVGQFQGDVLVFVEGTGFGPAMFDTAALFDDAATITIDYHPELGEADPYFGTRWKHTFLKPLERWLRRTL